MNEEEKKVKHLELIQANILRMNQCSFQMKGWMLTIVSALLALYAASISVETGQGNNIFIIIAILPTVLFWYLDSYYLQQEKKFRGVYNDVISDDKEVKIKEFDMPLGQYEGCKYCLLRIMFSKTEAPLYLITIIALTIAGLFI